MSEQTTANPLLEDALEGAFTEAAQAREDLDAVEDNVRALVVAAVASGTTWATLEELSGLSALELQHRYRAAASTPLTVTHVTELFPPQ